MQIVRTIEELSQVRRDIQGTVAFVPTMGALHDGHLALIAEARSRADAVVASIFVNPSQFAAGEDLEHYPRQEQRDIQLLRDSCCGLAWVPAVQDIYPPGFATTVRVSGISEQWEGEARPGHFDGVATVVARLILAVRPDLAIFGEKDFQQLAVIRRMALDLGLPAEIIGVPTVRAKDGLALSSRNVYLDDEQRRQAAILPLALSKAGAQIRAGIPVAQVLHEGQASLRDGGFSRIDYFALVNGVTLEALQEPSGSMRLIAAAVIGMTRLIDNLPV